MEVGKIPNNILNKLILENIKNKRSEILIRPAIGEDCTAIDLDGKICVLSTDPVTGAANNIGKLAVHISCNDVASSGAEPIGILITILAPPSAEISDFQLIMKQAAEVCDKLNVEILGGHTEITSAVNRFVLSSTVIGKTIKDKLVLTSGAQAGDDIIMTKWAGLEGTAIIAADMENELGKTVGTDIVKKAKGFINHISVVKEGMLAGEFGVNSMHDITEGGVLGAVWEVLRSSGKGGIIYKDKIPVKEETSKICEHFNIDPFRLISSGSMLITCKKGAELIEILKKNNIEASIIGIVNEGNEIKLKDGDDFIKISQPGSDELYKVIK